MRRKFEVGDRVKDIKFDVKMIITNVWYRDGRLDVKAKPLNFESGIKTIYDLWSDGSEFEIDKQYYREERLKKLLDEKKL